MSSVDALSPSVSPSLFDIDLEAHYQKVRQEKIVRKIEDMSEEIVSKHGLKCPMCKSKLHSHGKTKGKEVWTLAGMVIVTLRRLRCKSCSYLVVPAKHLIADGLLSSLAEKFIELCRSNSFARSRELLNSLLGIDIPVMTLHSYVRRQSRYFDDEILRATTALYESGLMPRVDVELGADAPLYLAIDEGLVKEWKYSQKDGAKTGKKSFVLTYCAVFFDGRERISGPSATKPRYKLTNRYGHASATTDIDQFFSELVMLSFRRGLTSKNTLFILTDGAKYLARGIENYFPNAIHLLDIFHLKKKIKKLICETHPLYEVTMQAVHSYHPEAIIKCIKQVQVFDEDQAVTKEELITYIKRNSQIIKNHKHPKTKVHGSGAAEKSVDLLVARRFKNRGMSWTEKGCEALLYFCVLAYNNKLKSYWKNRHEQTGLANTPTKEKPVHTKSLKKTRQKHGHYYNQARLIDCERTKGTNTSSMAASHKLK